MNPNPNPNPHSNLNSHAKNSDSGDGSDRSQSSADMWLDHALRDAGDRYVPDDGFTAHVLAALPPQRAAAVWRRPLLIGGAAIVGVLIAVACGGAGLAPSVERLAQSSASWLAQPLPGTDAYVTFGSLVAVALGGGVSWLSWRRAMR